MVSTGYVNTNHATFIGGIVGYTIGNVSKCYNNAEINSIYATVGGIVGYTSSNITFCYNTGKVVVTDGNLDGNSIVGGIAGVTNSGKIEMCYNTAEIVASKNIAGGIVGASNNTTYIYKSYNVGNISANSAVGNILAVDVGKATSTGVANIEDCYYLGTKTENQERTSDDMKTSEFINLLGGENYWKIETNVNSGYPTLKL